MRYTCSPAENTVNAIQIKLEQINNKRITAPIDAMRFRDLITKLDKISDELTGLVNNVKDGDDKSRKNEEAFLT